MFERRLKILISVIVVLSFTLFCRVFAVQVVKHSYWQSQAIGLLTKPQTTETTRGRILDVHGKLLALDVPCTDVCVDYRAIIDPPDPKWVQATAIARLRNRIGGDYHTAKAAQRKVMVEEEIKQTQSDIRDMWKELALINPKADVDTDRVVVMNVIRSAIVESVHARRKEVAALHLQLDQQHQTTSSKWLRWLARSHDEDSGDDNLAELQEQIEPHVILPALDADNCNVLGEHLEHLPGLVLRASTRRSYPLKTIACHLLGSVGRVSASDLGEARQNKLDELRKYGPNDLIGKQGIESLCEPLLRGSRGKIERRVSDDSLVSQTSFVPGSDVHLTIDSDLQDKAQFMMQHVQEQVHNKAMQLVNATPEGGVSMHAAVVILDVKTNEVRVLASNPGFDVNDLQDRYRYAALSSDDLNQPLINRATQDTLAPGSTVKPLVGLGGITDKFLGAEETLNCTGYLYLPAMSTNGKVQLVPIEGSARCWKLSENPNAYKHPDLYRSRKNLPADAQHGPLTFAQALERSCDIFFETAADRITPDRLNYWFDQFGIGRTTGIGIAERSGARPDSYHTRKIGRVDYCLSGMGQGVILATPLQIANEAATIARGGIWMRPRLLTSDTQAALDTVNPRLDAVDQVDLHLDPKALEQAHIGMINVVDGAAGTGRLKHPGFTLAAKTGTAETSGLLYKNAKLPPVYLGGEETTTPWYRTGKEPDDKSHENSFVHSWYMGYAPAENPQVAFCVVIEFAGAGGSAGAGPVAIQMLEACDRAGYLHPQTTPPPGSGVALQQ